MVNLDIIEHEPMVFNFRKHWKNKCKPHLFNKNVVNALNCGMYHIQYVLLMEHEKEGFNTDNLPRWSDLKAPWEMTCCDMEWRQPRPHSVNWYRPFGYCWGIAPFCKELGKCIYPELEWRIIRGYKHTVAVGFKESKPYMIFDILNFDSMSAREILDFAGYKGPRTKRRASGACKHKDRRMAEAA